jgi:hypothetical protein
MYLGQYAPHRAFLTRGAADGNSIGDASRLI